MPHNAEFLMYLVKLLCLILQVLFKKSIFFAETEMADEKEPIQSVQVFGRKKTATAVAYCKRGKGLIKVNGRPLEQVEPKALQFKLQEPVLLLGKERLVDNMILVYFIVASFG